jgi:hypothetical protein
LFAILLPKGEMTDDELVQAFEVGTPEAAAQIAERIRAPPDLDWDAFASRHVDLLSRQQPSILTKCDAPETLASEHGRLTFVPPERDVYECP